MTNHYKVNFGNGNRLFEKLCGNFWNWNVQNPSYPFLLSRVLCLIDLCPFTHHSFFSLRLLPFIHRAQGQDELDDGHLEAQLRRFHARVEGQTGRNQHALLRLDILWNIGHGHEFFAD